MISYPGCGAYMRVALISVPDHVSKRLLYVGANSNNDDICVLFITRSLYQGLCQVREAREKLGNSIFPQKVRG